MNIILSYNDIKERQRNLTSCDNPPKYNTRTLFENLKSKYSYQNAKLILEDWKTLSDQEIDAFDKVLEVFDIVCQNDNIGNINNISNIIEGKIIPKVRDGKATRHLNNYKLGKFKIQNTKALHHNKDNNNAVKTAMSNKGSVGNSLHPHRKYKYDIYGNRVGENKNKKQEEQKEEKVEECFDRFIKASQKNDQCDRVLSNYSKLTRRFDLDSKVRSLSSFNQDSIIESIYEMCELIDGYEIPFGVKYNIALEEVLYLMNKNCINVSNSIIAEAVTDYFLLSRDCTDESLHDMAYILENNHFYSEEDLTPISYIYKEENESEKIISCSEEALDSILEESKKSKESNIKKLMHEFKTSKNKSVSLLRRCITRIFVNSPENIIKEIPDIFSFIRTTGAIALFGINPVIGIMGLITQYFLKMKIRRSEMQRVIAEYKKHRDKYKEKMNKTDNPKGKKKYEAMVKKLNEDINKLEEYEDTLYTEKENEKRSEEKYAKEAENDSDFDFDFNFDESVINSVNNLSMLIESMDWNQKDIMASIKNNIRKMDSNDIYNITESVILCNNIFDPTEYSHILEDELLYYRSQSGLSKYEMIDTINECIDKINKIKYDNLFDDDINYESIDTLYEYSKYLKEITDDTIELVTRSKVPFNEGSGLSISSKLKVARTNLKSLTQKLKDKDKTISNKIDVTMDQVQKSAENALISKNREAVIKGKLLPSASQCIKAAVATGAAWLVSPALAVIGVLGSVAMSKKLQKKERKLILDDIEIELDMCERYLKLAEEKNDMKAIRNIMQTKRSLQRQQQRLKYNMAVEFNEKVPKSPSAPENYDEQYVLLPKTEVL